MRRRALVASLIGLALACLVVAGDRLVSDASTFPQIRITKPISAGTINAYPFDLNLDFGEALEGSYSLVYTYGGTTELITVAFQGSVDNSNWITIATPVSASSANVALHRIAISSDAGGTTVNGIVFPFYRLRFTTSAGTPPLTAVTVNVYRRDLSMR